MSHPEKLTIKIPFEKKKSETELPLKKYTHYNTTSKKKKIFLYMIILTSLKIMVSIGKIIKLGLDIL